MVPLAEVSRYFEFAQDSPHMSFVAPVRNPELMPAASHVDNTARLQTICPKNGLMNSVLAHIGKATGVPVALNTSFNLAGEPIVETPADAIKSAVGLKLDRLVVGNYMLDLSGATGGMR
jgi:carbamoyltransferase